MLFGLTMSQSKKGRPSWCNRTCEYRLLGATPGTHYKEKRGLSEIQGFVYQKPSKRIFIL